MEVAVGELPIFLDFHAWGCLCTLFLWRWVARVEYFVIVVFHFAIVWYSVVNIFIVICGIFVRVLVTVENIFDNDLSNLRLNYRFVFGV